VDAGDLEEVIAMDLVEEGEGQDHKEIKHQEF
jgi:hypothetical protein